MAFLVEIKMFVSGLLVIRLAEIGKQSYFYTQIPGRRILCEKKLKSIVYFIYVYI